MFFFTGIGNATTFRKFPIIFGNIPHQATGVIGWIAAIAAYGPFIFATIIGAVISANGNAKAFFVGLLGFILPYKFNPSLSIFFYNNIEDDNQ